MRFDGGEVTGNPISRELCSACYHFAGTERLLLSKHGFCIAKSSRRNTLTSPLSIPTNRLFTLPAQVLDHIEAFDLFWVWEECDEEAHLGRIAHCASSLGPSSVVRRSSQV